MSITRIIAIVIVIAAAGFIVHVVRDPLRTRLPFATTDLATVEPALRRLKPDERSRVEAYVKRSNGDVLPVSMADPDQPFTARSFAEAIELEKRWEVKRDAQQAVASKAAAARDEAMAPLRAVVEASVVRTEILSPRDLAAPPSGTDGVKRALPSADATVFVVTVSIHNLGSRDIVGLQGSLEAKDRDAYLPLDLCWVDVSERARIDAASRTEIRCANVNRQVSPDQRAYMQNPAGRFTTLWYPKKVRFADGTSLDSGL